MDEGPDPLKTPFSDYFHFPEQSTEIPLNLMLKGHIPNSKS